MPHRDLLPGVNSDHCPPVVVFDSGRAIRRARRVAAVRDAMQLILIAAVDYLFAHFPHTHVPTLDRHNSLMVLVALNVMLLAHVVLSRAIARWRARRVASTWCVSERSRFQQQAERRRATR